MIYFVLYFCLGFILAAIFAFLTIRDYAKRSVSLDFAKKNDYYFFLWLFIWPIPLGWLILDVIQRWFTKHPLPNFKHKFVEYIYKKYERKN